MQEQMPLAAIASLPNGASLDDPSPTCGRLEPFVDTRSLTSRPSSRLADRILVPVGHSPAWSGHRKTQRCSLRNNQSNLIRTWQEALLLSVRRGHVGQLEWQQKTSRPAKCASFHQLPFKRPEVAKRHASAPILYPNVKVRGCALLRSPSRLTGWVNTLARFYVCS